jgi:cell division protein FtsI (penicillin-binding protein 3)
MPPWRSRLLVLIIMASFAALLGRAFYLQILNNDFLQEKGDSRYRRDIEVFASRGKITDRNGDVLAVSTPMQSIWAFTDTAKLAPEELKQLAGLLGMDGRELAKKLASDKNFVYLKRQVPPEVGMQIAALKLKGIHQDREYRRYYPTGDMTAHIVGFTGLDDRGLEGVELAFQSSLIGRQGSRSVIKDRRDKIVEDVGSIRPPQDGKDVVLALDGKVQYIAFSTLKQAVLENKAKAGSAVVLDAQTGEVLALANWPTYNPNNRESLTGAQLRNRALTDNFEPGSTMKPFTVALAIDKNRVRPETLINCAPGKLTIGTATISDAHANGVLSVQQVIQKSSNVGTSKIALGFKPQEMWEMFDAAGFGKTPKLGFPGETPGRLRPSKNWVPIDQATMSYGHGISVSLMQMARAYTTLAGNGELLPVSLVKVNEGEKPQGTRVFSAETARQLRLMLEMAAGPEGTAPLARVAGYRVGGKTGTAYKVINGAYAKKYVSSFVGVAPISAPRLVVAVMVDEPSAGKHYGGDVAAPIFAQIVSGALRTLGVPQDAPGAAKGGA